MIAALGAGAIADAPRPVGRATIDTLAAAGTRQWVGYSFSWFAAMAARAGRAEEALLRLRQFERSFTLRNGFHANGEQTSACAEGGFIVSAERRGGRTIGYRIEATVDGMLRWIDPFTGEERRESLTAGRAVQGRR